MTSGSLRPRSASVYADTASVYAPSLYAISASIYADITSSYDAFVSIYEMLRCTDAVWRYSVLIQYGATAVQYSERLEAAFSQARALSPYYMLLPDARICLLYGATMCGTSIAYGGTLLDATSRYAMPSTAISHRSICLRASHGAMRCVSRFVLCQTGVATYA
eukprot:3423699-Rhodomonas_salina.1